MIKSQDDLNPCNNGKRSSDVLIETISKLETTTKQLEIAKKALDVYAYQTIKGTETGKNIENIVTLWSREIFAKWKKDYKEKKRVNKS